MNWLILTLFGIAVIALIIFLVMRNKRDRKEFEDQVNKDYHKSKDEEGDIDAEGKMK